MTQNTLVQRNTGTNRLHDLVDQMQSEGVLEDRREYEASDLKRMYGLSDEEADDLFFLVQDKFSAHPINEVNNIPAELIKEYIVESLHCTQEGWTEHEWIIVERFLQDMVVYGQLARRVA